MVELNSIPKKITILGAGIWGASLADFLAQEGAEVTVVEREFKSPHNKGSSHGGTRMTRIANFEGEQYVATARRTIEIYNALQKRVKKYGPDLLFRQNGTLMFGPKGDTGTAHGQSNPIQGTFRVAEKFNIRHRKFTGHEIREKFVGLNINDDIVDDTIGYYEPESGTLFAEKCIEAHIESAKENGAKFLMNTKVIDIRRNGAQKSVILANKETIEADEVVVCAGPWVRDFVPDNLKQHFRTERHVFVWFKTEGIKTLSPKTNKDIQTFSSKNHPNFVIFRSKPKPGLNFYGFPSGLDNGHPVVKIAKEDGVPVDPSDPTHRIVRQGEINELFNRASPYIKNFDGHAFDKATCIYTLTPDQQFTIDQNPDNGAWVVSCCNGYGFKNAPALAERLAQKIMGREDGKSKINLDLYSWKNRGIVPA